MENNALKWARLMGGNDEGLSHFLMEEMFFSSLEEEEEENQIGFKENKEWKRKIPVESEELQLSNEMQFRRKGDLLQPELAQQAYQDMLMEDLAQDINNEDSSNNSYVQAPELVPH